MHRAQTYCSQFACVNSSKFVPINYNVFSADLPEGIHHSMMRPFTCFDLVTAMCPTFQHHNNTGNCCQIRLTELSREERVHRLGASARNLAISAVQVGEQVKRDAVVSGDTDLWWHGRYGL